MVLTVIIGIFGYVEVWGKKVDDHKILLAHYMPWYVSKPFNDKWGWHWTMNYYNPDEIKPNGQRKIASHYYPIIEPYDSADPDVLECQTLLMKFAGIDGIIIDWYGIEDFYDYEMINKNTQQVIKFLEKAGLKFAICYEDQSVKHLVNAGHISEQEAIKHGQKVMIWLQENFFNKRNYLKLNNRPVFLTFGPQYFKGEQWNEIFSVLSGRPFFCTISRSRDIQDVADGYFGWIPVDGNITDPKEWQEYLTSLYAKHKKEESCIGIVFPQFHDIYEDAQVHKSYGFIDRQGTKTFEETLDIALKSDCKLIQIATWNDYGEGTMIEPTAELGYSYLEIIQRQREIKYKPDDLRLPVKLYKLKKKYQQDQNVMKELERCSELLFSGKLKDASKIINKYK